MDTKRIEQIRKEAVDERQMLRGGDGLSFYFASLCLELLGHVSSLEDWKAQASRVLDGLQLQEIAKEIGVQIGQDIGPAILPWIRNQKVKASKVSMAPHVFAQMVDRVRALAFDFGTYEQFRGCVSEVLRYYIDLDAKARAVVVPEYDEIPRDHKWHSLIWDHFHHGGGRVDSPVREAWNLCRRLRAIPADRELGDGMVHVEQKTLERFKRIEVCARDFQERQRNLSASRDSYGFFQAGNALEAALRANQGGSTT